jgi:hypothetical protein
MFPGLKLPPPCLNIVQFSDEAASESAIAITELPTKTVHLCRSLQRKYRWWRRRHQMLLESSGFESYNELANTLPIDALAQHMQPREAVLAALVTSLMGSKLRSIFRECIRRTKAERTKICEASSRKDRRC